MLRSPSWRSLALWFDAYSAKATAPPRGGPVDGDGTDGDNLATHRTADARTGFHAQAAGDDPVQWGRIMPFVLLHLACVAVIWVGVSGVALAVAGLLYVVRMIAITGFYHRYFSHRAFKTSRVMQFVFAVVGSSAVQRGPLWWAAHHRMHHKHSDTARDAHSPHAGTVLWSHVTWFTTRRHHPTQIDQIRDFAVYPELRFLDRFDKLIPLLLALSLFGLGAWLERAAPHLGTSGWQLVVWGFCISTVVLFHATSAVNSLGHLFGRQRFDTGDHSRNNAALALLTFGEGWHNNHHFYPVSARQGFFWWEVDLTYYVLRAMSAVGLIWDLRPVPAHVRRGERTPARRGAAEQILSGK